MSFKDQITKLNEKIITQHLMDIINADITIKLSHQLHLTIDLALYLSKFSKFIFEVSDLTFMTTIFLSILRKRVDHVLHL